jgi:alpha-tubulin suppressor-like RCC1 family protein
MAMIRHRLATLTHRLCSSYSTTTKTSTLYTTDTPDSTTIQLLSWGKGASGQLGGGVEETRLYPSPVTNLLLPKLNFTLFKTPGLLPGPEGSSSSSNNKVVKVGISCGLFHSCLVVDGELWVWGKGDGGRLGLGHENSLFVPTLNPHLDNVSSVALGGLHSVALTSTGEVFTWSESLQPFLP